MDRVIETFHTLDNKGKAEVRYSPSDEQFYIKYFDDHGKAFYTEDFPNKSLDYVCDAAENWISGIKKLA